MRRGARRLAVTLGLALTAGCSSTWSDATMRRYLAEHEQALTRITAEASDGPVLMSNIRYYDVVNWLPRVVRTSESVYDALRGVSGLPGASEGTYWPSGRMYTFLVRPGGDDSRSYRLITMVRRPGSWLVRSSFHGVLGGEMTLAGAATLVGMTGDRLLATIMALDSLGNVTVAREFPRSSLRPGRSSSATTSARVVGIQLAGRTRLVAASGPEAQAHLMREEVVRHLDGPWFYGDREAVR